MKPYAIYPLVCVALWTQAQTVAAHDPAIRIAVNASAPGKPLVHFWSKVVGAGRANEALRATWQEELHTAATFDGFHGIFHDDIVAAARPRSVDTP